MIRKIVIIFCFLVSYSGVFISGAIYENNRSKLNKYNGAQKLIAECQRELKRTQQCILIAVEDEPESAANDANNNH